MEALLQTLANGLLLSCLYALVALGLALVFGVMNIVNFAHGEFVMLGAFASYWLFAKAQIDPLFALPIVIVGMAIFGMAIYWVTIAPIINAPHINQILLTFGAGLVLQNVALLLWSADTRSVNPGWSDQAFPLGPIFLNQGRIAGAVVALLLFACLLVWLDRSRTGRALRAVSQNRAAASIVGVNVSRMFLLAFVIGAALAGAAGTMVSVILYTNPYIGFGHLIAGFAIVVLGGAGNVKGTLVAAFIIGVSEALISRYVTNGSAWAEGLFFLTIIGVLVLRPQGLLGKSVA